MRHTEIINGDQYVELADEALVFRPVSDGNSLGYYIRHPDLGELIAFPHPICDYVIIAPALNFRDRRAERKAGDPTIICFSDRRKAMLSKRA